MDSPEAIEYQEFVGDLRAYIRLNRSIPRHLLVESCIPPQDEPNIILVTAEKAFLYNKGRLARKSPTFAQAHMSNLSDDSVDIVDDYPVVNLDDGDRTGDVFCFLRALADDDLSPYPLTSRRDYYYLSGVLCLTTRYQILEMRIKAIMVLEKLYPTNFDAWNHTRKLIRQFDWRLEHTDVINLARWVSAWTILPAAMATLANDMSADEVFNVPFDEHTPIRHPVKLNGADAPAFATMKEHHHISTRKMLLWMRTLGEGCNNPPEYVPSMAGKAPVGALKPKPSQCATAFKQVASNLLDEVYLVKPVGYADFYDMVAGVEVDKTRVCKKCRQQFERGHVEMREKWWDVVPKILGFKGWEDERLRPAETWMSPQPVEQLHQMMIDFQII